MFWKFVKCQLSKFGVVSSYKTWCYPVTFTLHSINYKKYPGLIQSSNVLSHKFIVSITRDWY